MKYFRMALVSLLAGSLFIPCSLVAQTDRGSIKGEVQDEQKALAPGVTLTLTNEATGVVSTTISQSSGEYNFSNLQPGAYTLTTSSAGFGKSVLQHISVTVGSTLALNVMLRVASMDQVMDVTANGSQVESQTSEISTTITPREIRDLPVPMSSDMRNPLSFVTLTPGVAGSQPGADPDYRLHVSGAPSDATEVYIDGIPVVNTALAGDVSLNHPPIDAVSEFKIINNNESAQYGFAGSAVSFAFKSGTNDYHGSLFEFLQNDKLNANTYVNNALHQKRPPLKQNEYGGLLGGPVRIPHFYDGRDKTFFFAEYSRFSWRPSSSNASLTTFPTQYRSGDFSQSLGAQLTDPASGQPVFDVLGRPVLAGQIYDPTPVTVVVDGTTYVTRNPVAGNKITTGISPASQKILNFFPTATSNALNNNLIRVQSTKNDEDRFVIKVDQNFSAKHSVSGSFFMGSYNNGNNGGLNQYDATTTYAPTKQVRGTYNFTYSPRVSNNLNAGFLRDLNNSGPSAFGPGLGALGISGFPVSATAQPLPVIRLQGDLSSQIGATGVSEVAENRYVMNDNLSLIRGKHSFTVGGELRRLQRNEKGVGAPAFNFTAQQSGLNGTGYVIKDGQKQTVAIPSGTGNSGASFLYGGVNFTNATFPASQGYRWLQGGVYVQDDWKVSPSLVLNLGVRYDIQVPRTEVKGYASTVDPTLPNPAAGGILGAYTFYGTGAGKNGQARIGKTDFKAIQPRIGFAWSPYADRKTALRGGFAIIRPTGNDNLENGIGAGLYSIGYSGSAVASAPNDAVGTAAYQWDTPFNPNQITTAQINPGILTGLTNPVIIHPSAGSPPTQINWSMQVQQEMPHGLLATIGYVGSHSYHIGVWSKPNEVNPAVAAQFAGAAQNDNLSINAFLALPVTDPQAVAAGVKLPFPNFVSVIGAPGATVAQALRPFPQYGSVDNPINPIGSVSYNGLQTSLQKRFSKGLSFLLAYTYSKTIGNVDSNNGLSSGAENATFSGSFYQDYYNPRAERAVTSSDVPHVVALSYTYELPIGKGKTFLNHGGVLNEVVGGWEVTGIQQYQTGRPIHIEYDAFGEDNPYRATDGFSFRPNVVPGVPLKNPQYKKSCSGPRLPGASLNPCQFLINPAAFVKPPSGQFGNAPHFFSQLRLPGFLNENLSASKRFQLYERSSLQFQANFFNAFNRVVFSNGGNPNTFIFNSAPPDLSAASLSANQNTVFGIMTDQQNAPRIIQFALKLDF